MPHDLNDATPSSFSHIVGQKTVVDQLQVALDASFADFRRLDDCLLVGPPGLGKSQIAHVLACELAVTSHEILGQSVKNTADLNALLLGAGDGEVIFIDEVHELAKSPPDGVVSWPSTNARSSSGAAGLSSSLPLAEFTLAARHARTNTASSSRSGTG